jgi:hypothetical protein
MTCNDTGYQAIEFDSETHLPRYELYMNYNIWYMRAHP